MDYAFEKDWNTLVAKMTDRFGEEPDVTTMVFAVGLQEAGQGARRYKKDEKMDLMHVGVCTLAGAVGPLRARGRGRGRVASFHRGRPFASAEPGGTRDHDEAGPVGLLRRVDRKGGGGEQRGGLTEVTP